MNHPGRRGEVTGGGSRLASMKTDVYGLISEWERRVGGGDCGDSLELPDMDGGDRGRRVSQEFTELRQKYVDFGGEGGGGRMSDGPSVTFDTCFDVNYTQGRGATRKLQFHKNKNSSMVGKSGPPLARTPSNGKRKWAVETTDVAEGGKKRYRGGM